MTFDYKKYSLEKLQEWIHDAMGGEASPHEIYSAIREAVCEDYYYHKDAASRSYGLLELLNGHRPIADKELLEAALAEREYYEGANQSAVASDKVVKWQLPVEIDGASGEYFVQFPDDLLEATNLKEGDQIEWVDQGGGSYLLKKVE